MASAAQYGSVLPAHVDDPFKKATSGATTSSGMHVLLWARVVAGGSAIALGTSWGGFGGVGMLMQKDLEVSTAFMSFVTSVMYVLIPFGSLVAGSLADLYGRLPIVVASYVGISLGLLILAASSHPAMILVGRIIESLGTGLGLASTATYISELAPANIRGSFTAMEETFMSVGIILGYILNRVFVNVAHGWRWALLAGAVTPALMTVLVALGLCPESPRFYHLTGQESKAIEVLHKLVSQAEAQKVLESWSSEDEKVKRVGWSSILWPSSTQEARALRTGICVMAIQMLSGIVLIGVYTGRIFDADTTIEQAFGGQIVVGLLRLAGSVLALLCVESAGRRNLLLISSVGMALGYAACVGVYLAGLSVLPWKLLALSACAVMFEVGVGPVPFVYSAEVLPTALRSKGMAAALAISRWIAAGQLLFFPMFSDAFGYGPSFSVGMVSMLMCTIYIYIAVPETKGVELEDMPDIFK
mmetsp:Transcript_52673/g.125856  ORF Transcript_52673/g.125856 Transcript_52673/m.125856 type:complete len:473 (+) Transcript_52673:123-1541(+)